MTIIPAVIPQSEAHLKDTLTTLAQFSKEVQVDIVDGVFVPGISWPYSEDGNLQPLSQFTETMDIEIDLMVKDPELVMRG